MTTYEPGSVIAGYRIDSLIGRGGMAVVYRAEDIRLGRRVALKLLTPQLADNEQFRQRFIQESRLAASLDHPNIVPIYGAGEADGQLYIAMRYVVGHDLKALLADQGGRLPVDWALRLVGQIGDALDSAHRAGLVHRDVKPANVLVAESKEGSGHAREDHAYLTDFGVTKRTTELSSGLTGTGHFLGTVDYVSPEQIQSKPVGPGTDIYALGCVLYECLTGLPPFQRDDDAALLWAHLVETPAPISGIRPEVPDAVSAVVARAMAKDPADRYESCEELVYELESALDQPVLAAAPTAGQIQDGEAATDGPDATSDGVLPEVGTVAAEDVPDENRPLFVQFPATAEALYETTSSADDPSALGEYAEPGQHHEPEWEYPEQEHDAGTAADEREHVMQSAPFPVADDRSHLVAAVAATPSVSTEGPRPSGSRRRRPAVRLMLVGVLALALGAVAVGANLLDPVDATPVVAEPADSPGDDPFTPPPPGGTPSKKAPPAGGGSGPDTEGGAPTKNVPVSGDAGGLYGGTGAEACSAESMAAFFDDHPDEAEAWAEVQGIEPSEIESFLGSLTPVVLRTDTAVTNHGFRDGKANAYQAVLQAGTAVMVDEYGVPRVRCACGNPLDAPEASDAVRYTGETWSELGSRPVTVIEAAPAAVEQFTVLIVLQDATVVVDRLPGTDGDQDTPAASEVVEAALEFSVEAPADGESGEDARSDGTDGTGDEPATDGTDGTGDEAATDGTTGTGDEAATGGTDGTGEQSATDGTAGTGGDPATGGTAGTGEQSATDGTAGTGGDPATDGTAGTGEQSATDGTAGTGGDPATDGTAGTGGEPATDGTAGTGGDPATDGTAGTGGEPATDGTAGTGGLPATDGTAGTGGEPATDGTAGTGEQSATDGTAGTGEQPATDGTAGTGGLPATDGTAGTGGLPATDGTAGTGGDPATDGTAGTGGEPATDGSTGSGDVEVD